MILVDDQVRKKQTAQVLVRWMIDGDMRFISHRDTLRLFARAALRAGLEMRYSQGFNPRPRLILPLPRSVGMAGDDEVALLGLAEPCDSGGVAVTLEQQMPEGISIRSVEMFPGTRFRLCSATYELELSEDDWVAMDHTRRHLTDHEDFWVNGEHDHGSDHAERTIHPNVQPLKIDGRRLTFETFFENNQTTSPRDLLEELGLAWDRMRYKIRRKRIVLV